ncbi:MAG: hypothetical protein AAB922_00545, partial [Patescibacteria group bacterium]
NLKKKLGIFGIDQYEEYRDSDSKSRENAQKYFTILKERGFIKHEDGQYFLDIEKITKETNFFKILEGIRFAQGNQIRKRLHNLSFTLNRMYPISKPREFATEIPLENRSYQKINPIFDLAVSPLLFSERTVDYSIDGSRTMLHGTFIPLVIWSGLFNRSFSKNISIHGYALGDSEMDANKFYGRIDAGMLNSDIMRYCAIRCTESFEDKEVNLENILGAKKLLYRALNLSKHILKHHGIQRRELSEEEELKDLVNGMNPSKAIRHFESEIFGTSRKTHHKGVVGRREAIIFLKSINVISSIFPITVRRIEEIVYNGKL